MQNKMFNTVKLVAVVHDEICIEAPNELGIEQILVNCMESASTEYCKFSKIPAAAEVGTCWIH